MKRFPWLSLLLLPLLARRSAAFAPPLRPCLEARKELRLASSTPPPADGPNRVEFDVIEEEEYEQLRARRGAASGSSAAGGSDGAAKPGDGKTGTGAGVFGAVVGGMVGGPLGALTAGLAGAWLAENGEGRAGSAARKAGEVTNSVLERSRDMNEKYKFTDKARSSVRRGVESLKKTIQEFDRDI